MAQVTGSRLTDLKPVVQGSSRPLDCLTCAELECPILADTVEKLDFLPRSQFLRQQAGFKKKALRVRQKG
jgi:hypothetical protein